MSHDELALLAAVKKYPDADLPKLVMADWHEENGDPDRAEFIRLQIELRKPAMGNYYGLTPELYERYRLTRPTPEFRMDDLLLANWREWIGAEGGIGLPRMRWDNGFLTWAKFELRWWAENGRRLISESIISSVSCRDISPHGNLWTSPSGETSMRWRLVFRASLPWSDELYDEALKGRSFTFIGSGTDDCGFYQAIYYPTFHDAKSALSDAMFGLVMS